MLTYEDGHAAIEWLTSAFGFREVTRVEDGGSISHAELDTGSGVVMLATGPPGYEGPARHRRDVLRGSQLHAHAGPGPGAARQPG